MDITGFDGHAFGSNYRAYVMPGQRMGLPAVQAQLIERLGNWPIVSGIRRPGERFQLVIIIEDPTNLETLRTQLFQWFDPEDETPKALAGLNDDGPCYLMVICEALQPWVEGKSVARTGFVASLVIDGDTRWRSSDYLDSRVWSVTADGDQETFTNDGEDLAFPILTIEPTAGKAGTWQYRRWIPIVWKALAGATGYPIQIGALDTAALVETATTTTLNGAFGAGAALCNLTDASAFPSSGMAYITDAVNGDEQIRWTGKTGNQLTGCVRGIGGTGDVNHTGGQTIAVSKMLANGDDLRVWVDGVEDENRWLDGMDTANTYIWVNIDWSAEASTTLAAGIGAGDPGTTIEVADVTDFPGSGILLIGSEAFVYTGKNATDNTFTGVTRAAKGTAAAAHNIADNVYWIQHDVWILYGNEEAGAPATDNDYEPAFELDLSSNTSWVFEEFGEDDGLRSGSWVQQIIGGTPTFYGGNRGAAADPWIELGIYVAGAGEGRIYLYNPCYITNANFTNGEKWVSIVVNWDGRIESSADGAAYATEYAIPAPGAPSAWQAWSRNEAITAARPYVALRNAGAWEYLEAADCTITLDGTYTPVVTVGSEQGSIYALDCTITNETTGNAIGLVYNAAIYGELEIDTEAKTITDLEDNSKQQQALTVISGPRRHWLALEPGANVLRYDEDGVLAVTVTVYWERRYYPDG